MVASTFGVFVESSGRSQHDGGTVVGEVGEEPLAEVVAVIYGQVAHRVESTFGFRTEASRNLVDAFNYNITTCHIFCFHLVEILLRRIDGGLGKDLAETRWRQTCLGKAHEIRENFAVAGDEAAHTGATSTVAFGYGVEQDNVVLASGQIEYAEVFLSIVAEFAIDFVGEEEKVVFLAERPYCIEVFL